MPDGHASSYLSGLWRNSKEHIGLSTKSVLQQAELSKTDMGLSGSVTDKSGQPIKDASLVIYKHGGMINTVDKQGGYTAVTSSGKEGIFSFGAISSVYKSIRTKSTSRFSSYY